MATIKINEVELSNEEVSILKAMLSVTKKQVTNSMSYGYKHDPETTFNVRLAINDDQLRRINNIINYMK